MQHAELDFTIFRVKPGVRDAEGRQNVNVDVCRFAGGGKAHGLFVRNAVAIGILCLKALHKLVITVQGVRKLLFCNVHVLQPIAVVPKRGNIRNRRGYIRQAVDVAIGGCNGLFDIRTLLKHFLDVWGILFNQTVQGDQQAFVHAVFHLFVIGDVSAEEYLRVGAAAESYTALQH